jgi:hypothetical protein
LWPSAAPKTGRDVICRFPRKSTVQTSSLPIVTPILSKLGLFVTITCRRPAPATAQVKDCTHQSRGTIATVNSLYYLHAASHFVDRPEWAEIDHNGADLMIAASALRHGGIVVTNNTSDFAPTGAALENPF